MAQFFIHRPVFAWVIALFIAVLGGVAVTQLPINQYPPVAPPSIVLSVVYPGASARTLEDAVIAPIEREMNGSPGLLYMEAVAQSDGSGSITLSYDPAISPDLAQVDVQNRLARATPRLPSSVVQQGVRVDKANPNFLLFIILSSDTGSRDVFELGDYTARNVLPEIQRVPGVGQANLFGAERAMRIWLDPAKLVGYRLSPADVNEAIRAQNAQVDSGTLGDLPNVDAQRLYATVVVRGQLSTVEQFGAIVLRANADGSAVRLRDVARIELGAQSYAGRTTRINGKPSVGIGVLPAPGANALATAKLLKQRVEELRPYFPEGVKATIPYDSSLFIELSISQVVETLLEAVLLVFLVMYLFLQNIRYTLIPTLVVPVALLGSFATLLALGFSINVLTMFGMVLVIGIVVDDAIVVVENVERVMSTEGLPPLAATRKAMGQISSAIVGVTVVLISVFVPLAFFGGAIGNIYRQFAAVMVSSIAFSAFMALSLTPALCATLLKPVEAGHHLEKRGFFGRFNRGFGRLAARYEGWVGLLVQRTGRAAIVYVAVIAAATWVFLRLPTSFVPNEDQGNILVNVQLPPGAAQQRTLAVMQQVEDFMLKQPEVENMISVVGFSFAGSGQNAALGFVSLKHWNERKGTEHSAQALVARSIPALGKIRDAVIFPVSPPPIRDLGRANGFAFRLQDRGDHTRAELLAARGQLLAAAAKSPLLTAVRPDGLEDASQLQLDIDREKALAQGVSIAALNAVLGTSLGSSYVGDFPNAGRMQRVVVQAEAEARMRPEDLLQLHVMNSSGQPVPLASFASTRWVTGPVQTIRYNGYPAIRIAGEPAKGVSTGAAMAEMERIAAELPPGFAYEWTGISREEKLSGSTATILFAFSLLSVFLCLAALYESWSIPLAVLLVVPLGVLGVVLGADLRGLENDVYFKVGMITIIGLAAKNAVLIIEFAKELHARGHGLVESVREAAHLRFRPILMTSLAFMLGVMPLVLASGAGSASQRAIGTGVLSGMLTATLLAVLLVPVFFVVTRRLFPGSERQRRFDAHEPDAEAPGAGHAAAPTREGDA
ncbi:efflux RND transporter permease subunit [Roseateles sp.]|uniref:efflux RND transporter permease subunit n=1 Tax=Roseateles sp. TaxID=1971397 RepID=UPI003962A13D